VRRIVLTWAAPLLALGGCTGAVDTASPSTARAKSTATVGGVSPTPRTSAPAAAGLSCPPTLPRAKPLGKSSPPGLFVPGVPSTATACRYAGLNSPSQGKLIEAAPVPDPDLPNLVLRLNTAQRIPPGQVFFYPLDDGRRDVLLFGYGHGAPLTVIVARSGCGFTSTTGAEVFTPSTVTSLLDSLLGAEALP